MSWKTNRLPVLLAAFGVAVIAVVLWLRPRHPAHRALAPPVRPAEERCDANGWCDQSPRAVGATFTTFTGVWAASANDVWAAGLDGSAWHWDGVHWTAHHTGAKWLHGVYGFGTRAVWFAGDQAALYWDGSRFKRYDLPVRGVVSAVFGVTVNDVWAVSTGGSTAHWDGQSWSVVDAPFEGWLSAIWGASKTDYWAAGGRGSGEGGDTILHWDGQAWNAVRLPCSRDFTGLSGTASDDVWAVGAWGTTLHFDGHAWQQVPSPAERGLLAVWARARDDVWAVGEESKVLHYDGQAWSSAKPDWKWLRGVSGTATRELWAVGQDGWILHWQGARFRPEPVPQARPRTAAAGVPEPEAVPASAADSLDAEALSALARARQLDKEGKREQARAAFVEATGSDHEVKLRPLVELAYNMLSSNSGTPREIEDSLLAGTASADSELEAQAWFNLALLYKNQNQPEAERAALARSLARRKHAGVSAKLGARSHCVAELGQRPVAVTPSTLSGWPGICVAAGQCIEKQAVEKASPDNCRDSPIMSWERLGDHLRLTFEQRRLSAISGRPLPSSGADNAACVQAPETTTTAVFNPKSARLQAAVTVVQKHPVAVVLDGETGLLLLTGGGCDGVVAPDGSMQLQPGD